MAALYARAGVARGPFDIVVANAGSTASAPVGKVTMADWQASLAVNLTGAFLTVQPALAAMLGGRCGPYRLHRLHGGIAGAIPTWRPI